MLDTRPSLALPRSRPGYISLVTSSTPALFDYANFVDDLKRRIDGARLSAARAVNRELVALYWDIGRAIREQQARRGWGDAVVDRLARDLKTSFPGTAGFSAASLWRMRQFHETYTSPEFLAQLVRENERGAQRARGTKALATASQPQLAQAVRDMVKAVPWATRQPAVQARRPGPAALLPPAAGALSPRPGRASHRRHPVELGQRRVQRIPRMAAHPVRHHLRLKARGVVQAGRVHGEDVGHGPEGHVHG
jgi:hypothetical protein